MGLTHTPAMGLEPRIFRFVERVLCQDKLNLVNPFARDVTIFQDGTRFFESQVKHASISHPSAFAPTPTPRV